MALFVNLKRFDYVRGSRGKNPGSLRRWRFKPLHDVDLLEGTRAFVVLKPGRITSIARRYRTKVDKDAMSEFVEKRR